MSNKKKSGKKTAGNKPGPTPAEAYWLYVDGRDCVSPEYGLSGPYTENEVLKAVQRFVSTGSADEEDIVVLQGRKLKLKVGFE